MKTLGDPAEAMYRRWAARKGIITEEFGWRRPDFFEFFKLPANLRHLPDFCNESAVDIWDGRLKNAKHWLTEVKGVGRDEVVKFKVDNFHALRACEEFSKLTVNIFIYDSDKKRVSWRTTLDDIDAVRFKVPQGTFDDGPKAQKPFYQLHIDLFKWEPLPEGTERELLYEELASACAGVINEAEGHDLPDWLWTRLNNLNAQLERIDKVT